MVDLLEPGSHERDEINSEIAAFLAEWYEAMPSMNASGEELSETELQGLMARPSETGRPIGDLLEEIKLAGRPGLLHPSGGHMSYIPNAGLFAAVAGERIAASLNRYTGVAGAAPGMTAIEAGVTDWIASLFALGDESRATLLSGGSMANLTAIAAARTSRLGDDFSKGTLYVTTHTHHSVAKAARLAGFRDDQIRQVPVDHDLRMRPDLLAELVKSDADTGRKPFLVVASAGTTDTGTVDDLTALADVAMSAGLWMHTDGAYGGFFQLTERGQEKLRGIERSDSIALDPHKGLSIPFGSGALLVKDIAHLIEANQGRGAYLNHDEVHQGMQDISSLGPELTRPFRGLPVWLALHLHGIKPFRDALNRSLDLAEHAYSRLSGIRGIRADWEPDLSVVAFGFDDDAVGVAAMEAVNLDRKTHISSTIVQDRFILRLAILNRRTTQDHVDHAIDIIEKTLIG